ncbi:MAG: hypothetical protein RQ745_10075 [Longimicrobiales bacterium]|nr:hypothetical protein [Longimicrobiales bacterium]
MRGCAAALTALAGAVVTSFPLAGQVQEAPQEALENALHVFLDCNTFPCDSSYFRTEVAFVNWVRDRTLAQVQLLITSNQTGGGGRVYTLDFVGLQELEGIDDELTFTSLTTDTEDETLAGLSGVIAAGLARYSTLIGQSDIFRISPAEGVEARPSNTLLAADAVDDPWNFWVFEVGTQLDLSGEDTESEREYGGSFEARRTTQLWKVEFETSASFSRDERDLPNGEVSVDERTDFDADGLIAWSVADRWSLGTIMGAGISTRGNEDFSANMSAAVEFSFLPFVEAPRRALTLRYDMGLRYFNWDEETIFFQTSELRPQHTLRLQLFQRQPWGEATFSVDGSQFLHDTELWNVGFFGNLEFRITRGLNLNVRGSLDFLEDQIFVSAEGLTDEEILLGRFQRPTDMSYSLSLGLSFEFGSIFNNVVNNRFR